ncbi:glycerophosphodiester phosphodiesterase [Lignipirellula cremea]|uniref:Glycerophosphoryl diester phosphodiesterase n=1 Tax=Lignipirellula cremea TaxID=2528010 RepID=A0A518DLC9_9BACT|nr:glycerophosphodiester phosphodiesterase family protein [Lignipirellula cremea]QDU92643.1 Glycerophosphoryl diester phosphodiesterase [Lignipirellula cremea]
MTVCFKVLAYVLLLVAFHHCAAAQERPPLIVAHRGLLQHAPENTLANFRACFELRLGFEFDVQRTKDGSLVCIHDKTVNRTTNGTGNVAELTLEEIRQLDAGSWFDPKFAGEKVPTVEEVLKLIADHGQTEVLIAVDLKADAVQEEVVRMASQHKILHRLLFIGTTISDSFVRQDIRAASQAAQTAVVANKAGEFADALGTTEGDWVYFRFLPTGKQIEAVHQAGKRAFIAGATVSGNIPENWQQAAEAGIDGILTDYPMELAALLRRDRSQ